jgi:ComF family protein
MHWIEKLLLPPSCQLCGAAAENEELCSVCAQTAQAIDFACPLCALPNEDGSVCVPCTQQPPLWQSAHSALIYDGSVQTLMQSWKYRKTLGAQRLLCDTLVDWVVQQSLQTSASAIIAVPMHPKKLRKRGFNTAYALASALAKHWQRPLLSQALRRIEHTQAQAGLDRAQRQHNLQHAFLADIDALRGHHHVLLVDDVYTTGATLRACTQSLQKTGVTRVDVITLARALPHQGKPSA